MGDGEGEVVGEGEGKAVVGFLVGAGVGTGVHTAMQADVSLVAADQGSPPNTAASTMKRTCSQNKFTRAQEAEPAGYTRLR